MLICYLTESSPRSRSSTLSHPLEVDVATIFASTPVSSHLTAPLSLFPPSTPPALIRSLSPYGTRELPPLTDSHCALHSCLERSHGLPKIQWHIQTPPTPQRAYNAIRAMATGGMHQQQSLHSSRSQFGLCCGISSSLSSQTSPPPLSLQFATS
jgi:hypothetical protein